MNWLVIVSSLVGFLQTYANSVKTPTPPLRSDTAIKHLQAFLNEVLRIDPPLRVDGWLGPKTDAAIEQGIARFLALRIGA